MSEVKLAVEQRSEFGKGAARRSRKAGKIPAVLYGHGGEPQHLALPTIEFARVIRENGRNAVLALQIGGSRKRQLALTKTITVHPLKNYIQHVDLLVLERGEKVTVDIPVVLTGEPASGSLVQHELDTLSVEVDFSNIPEQIEINLDGVPIGTSYTASEITLPEGSELLTEGDYLVVAVNEAPTAAEMEEPEEGAEEGATAEGDEGEAAESGE